ncbi:hypothetical protein BS17DRAFT_767926 [Gyrodon lividus]|nr:hypothetical protein BS17DRAFT_767926 [Gyrodon lividus]
MDCYEDQEKTNPWQVSSAQRRCEAALDRVVVPYHEQAIVSEGVTERLCPPLGVGCLTKMQVQRTFYRFGRKHSWTMTISKRDLGTTMQPPGHQIKRDRRMGRMGIKTPWDSGDSGRASQAMKRPWQPWEGKERPVRR